MLCQELVNEGNSEVVRQVASLVIKNSITAKVYIITLHALWSGTVRVSTVETGYGKKRGVRVTLDSVGCASKDWSEDGGKNGTIRCGKIMSKMLPGASSSRHQREGSFQWCYTGNLVYSLLLHSDDNQRAWCPRLSKQSQRLNSLAMNGLN